MSNLSIIKIYSENYECRDFCLYQKCADVKSEEFNTISLRNTIRNMYETLYSYPSGVGLAANQVGILKRICVIDSRRDGKKPLVCINPEYVPVSNQRIISNEQCLSFPNITVQVNRFKSIKVTYKNIHGEQEEIVLEGFKANVLQHEIDHLNGKSFLDLVSDSSKIQYYDGFPSKLSSQAIGVLYNE